MSPLPWRRKSTSRSIVLSGNSDVGATEPEAQVLLHDADLVPCRAQHEVARELALVGEVLGDAGAQPADRQDRHAAARGHRWRQGGRRRAIARRAGEVQIEAFLSRLAQT